MSLLHRQHSLYHPSPKEITKPLPPLPVFSAVENVPRKQKHVSNGGRSLIRRVSSIFRSSPRRKPPPNLNLMHSAFNTSHKAKLNSSSLETLNESEDDIRRPSGLGSAISVTSNQSLPPSPFTPAPKDDSPFHPTPEFGYPRIRAISSPNLLRSFSLKAKTKVRRRRGSIAQASPPPQYPPPPVPPREPKAIKVKKFNLPVEVLEIILSYLARRNVASFAFLSRSFSAASRINLYRRLNLQTMTPIQLERLIVLLASRRDLSDLVVQFRCYTWPAFLSSPPSHDRNVRLRDTRLTEYFTLALQRMVNLVELTLPTFDISLLSHHSAFGLKSLTFLHSSMSAEERKALFTWLDGQINITSLHFPNLEDDDTNITFTNTPEIHHIPIPTHDNTLNMFLRPYPTASPIASPWPSPLSISFPTACSSPIGRDPFDSTTLLPSLTTIHATPSIILSLIPPKATSLHRCLQKVSLNISTTLYTGLRPAAVMACLRGVSHLSIQFCESVDKRTLEKVLGAAGAVLGSRNGCMFTREELQPPELYDWSGLQTLEISFRTLSALLPGMEKTLYRTIQTTLPRYESLRKLHLSFLSSLRYTKPLPWSPLEIASGKRFRFPAVEQQLEDVDFTAHEQARIDFWVKQCPSLQVISLSGTAWHNPARQVLTVSSVSPSVSSHHSKTLSVSTGESSL